MDETKGDAAVADALLAEAGGERGHGRARHLVVEAVVAHYLELVQHPDVGILSKLPGLVVNLFDVRLASPGLHHLGAVALDELEPLAAHALGKHHQTAAAETPAHPGAADAVVAGAGPDETVSSRIDRALDDELGEDRVGRSHLVAAGGKVAAVDDDDRRLDARDLPRHDEVPDFVVRPVPVDVIEVHRIEGIGLPGRARAAPDRRPLGPRLAHFRERGTQRL
jgi:hypothetical protein